MFSYNIKCCGRNFTKLFCFIFGIVCVKIKSRIISERVRLQNELVLSNAPSDSSKIDAPRWQLLGVISFLKLTGGIDLPTQPRAGITAEMTREIGFPRVENPPPIDERLDAIYSAVGNNGAFIIPFRECSHTHESNLKGNLDLRAYFELRAEGVVARKRTRVPKCGNTEWSRAPYHSNGRRGRRGWYRVKDRCLDSPARYTAKLPSR